MNLIKLLLVLITITAFTFPCFGRKNLRLSGTWEFRQKSLELKYPIVASLDEDYGNINLEFLRNLGPVSITVSNLMGETLYSTTIEVKEMSSLLIQIPLNEKLILSITDGRNMLYSYVNI